MRGLAWPWRLVLGLVVAALGCVLTTNPLASLDAVAAYVGVSLLVVGGGVLARPGRDRFETALGLAWCVLGLVVLLAPGHLLGALPLVIAVALLVAGALTLPQVRSGTWDQRLARGLLGLTQIVLGGVALTWGDLTLLVAAALFGVLLVVSGAVQAVDALVRRDRPRAAGRTDQDGDRSRERGLLRWGRVVAAALALVVSLVLLKVSDSLDAGAPSIDAFYTAPAKVPSKPGALLRADRFTREVPAAGRAWRILYTTTDALGRPAVASGIVVVPTSASGPLPVIAWAHGTTGYARRCAPSLLQKPFTAGAFPDVMDQVMAEGWAVVATDYAGLGTPGHQPYIIGRGEARSVLDAVRAARRLGDVDLDRDRTVVWGHSQGGGAALWTDQEQPSYAPDVPLAGTVAMAPAADPLALARNLPRVTGGSVFGSYVAKAYADTYPDLSLTKVVRSSAAPFVDKLASRCLSEPGVLKSVLTALSLGDRPIFRDDLGSGALGAHLRANVPRDPGPGPLLVAQGEADSLVVPSVTASYVAQLRKGGHRVELRTYPGLDHMPLVQPGSALLPLLMSWTKARLAAAR